MRNIGCRIKEIREQNGYTQTTLAKKLGLSRSAVNAWEMGVSIPSTQYLVELSDLFNVTTDYLLCIDNNENQMIDITFLTEEEKVIIFSLLKRFKKYHNALDLLKKNGELEHGDDLDLDF